MKKVLPGFSMGFEKLGMFYFQPAAGTAQGGGVQRKRED